MFPRPEQATSALRHDFGFSGEREEGSVRGASLLPSLGEIGARGPCQTPPLDKLSAPPLSYSFLRHSATKREGDVPSSRGGGPEAWETGPGESQSGPLPASLGTRGGSGCRATAASV